ncbi:MAG: ROK family transcriptional regulator [Chloroflexota bacterium]|nr:MAG: ROK family transcriptional regulator [Chloroflexota bacterium]
MRKATQQQTKEHNRNLVLKIIFENESISRAEIARITSLTRTTVSDIVSDLLADGLVSEVGLGASQGGKSPILISIEEDSRYLIGLNLASQQFSGAVVNLRGKIKKMVTLPVKDRNGDNALDLVFEILDQLLEASFQPLVGIGIGTAGLVNMRDGLVVNAVNLEWRDLPLARLVQDRYHLPVKVLNDSQAAAMGEYIYSQGPTADKNLIVINAHRGIGAGILIHGQLFQGDGGGAGEIGHIVVVPKGGLPCRCGNYGCLETVASSQALIRRVQALADGPSGEASLSEIEQAFSKGDPVVRELVSETGYYLGMAISCLTGALNIEKIILTGEMTVFGRPWLGVIQETVAKNTFPKLAQDIEIEFGKLGGNNVILGASALLANDYALLFNKQISHSLLFS